jgi:hypothetical protein
MLNSVSDVTNTKVAGLHIGCVIDTSTGELTFQTSGQDTGIKLKVEPGSMLYPAVFVLPTASEVFQFELGRIKFTFPLSAAMFKSSAKQLVPYCPPRLTVEKLYPVHWARVPNENLRTTALNLSNSRGMADVKEDGYNIEYQKNIGWSVLFYLLKRMSIQKSQKGSFVEKRYFSTKVFQYFFLGSFSRF